LRFNYSIFFVVVVVVLIWESTVLWRSPKCFINSTLFYESPPPKKKNIFVMIMLCGRFFVFFSFPISVRVWDWTRETSSNSPSKKLKKILLFCFFFEFWRF
jgi:hypothetical protein